MARDLGTGRIRHAFDVTAACTLARVELDLEVESMPDGVVTLRAPSGREARMSLHVLTTTHFVRTWDWAMLDELHAARGEPAAGTWTLAVRAVGAYYQGGAQPRGAPMPTPRFPSAELRVFCEPPHRAVPAGTELELRVAVPPATRRSGANVRALVPVEEECVIASLGVELTEDALDELGSDLRLVAPSGAWFPLLRAEPQTRGRHEVFTREVIGATGLSSAGLWEIVRTRASGSVEIREAVLQIRCAG